MQGSLWRFMTAECYSCIATWGWSFITRRLCYAARVFWEASEWCIELGVNAMGVGKSHLTLWRRSIAGVRTQHLVQPIRIQCILWLPWITSFRIRKVHLYLLWLLLLHRLLFLRRLCFFLHRFRWGFPLDHFAHSCDWLFVFLVEHAWHWSPSNLALLYFFYRNA